MFARLMKSMLKITPDLELILLVRLERALVGPSDQALFYITNTSRCCVLAFVNKRLCIRFRNVV